MAHIRKIYQLESLDFPALFPLASIIFSTEEGDTGEYTDEKQIISLLTD